MRATRALAAASAVVGLLFTFGCGGLDGRPLPTPSGPEGKYDRPVEPEPEPPAKSVCQDFLSAGETASVVDAIDDICGDTFCEGEYNWYVDRLCCDAESGLCQLSFEVRPHSQTWSPDVLDNVDPSLLQATGQSDAGPFAATVLETTRRDGEEGWMLVDCELDGGYARYDQLMVTSVEFEESFYWHFLACVDALEHILRDF